jgi:TolB-like protein
VLAALEMLDSGDDPGACPRLLPAGRRRITPAWTASLAVAIVGLTTGVAPHRTPTARAPIGSVAILPLYATSADLDGQALSDGISETLINSLGRIPELHVKSWNTVRRFGGRETDAASVARELGVGAVLTGRITHRRDIVAIGVELIDGHDGSHIWGARFTRPLADVLVLQENMSREILAELRLQLIDSGRRGEAP